MAYVDPSYEQKQADSFHTPYGHGLVQIIRDMVGSSHDTKLANIKTQNDANQTQELAAILKGMNTGRVGDSLVSAPADAYVPTDPVLKELVAKMRIAQSEQATKPMNLGAGDQMWVNGQKVGENTNKTGGANGGVGLQQAYYQDANGNIHAYLPSTSGAPVELQFPPGASPVMDSGRLSFDPNAIRGKMAATTQGNVNNINQTAVPAANAAGMVTASQESAKTAALPGQEAIKVAADVSKANQLAAAPLQRNSQAVLSLLDMAEPLLEDATGSGLGNLRDQAGAMVGYAGRGAENAGQLKAIGGLIVSKMPRMEGPQSDKDTALYREMAGQIGDPSVPTNVRKAALQAVRALNEKYATPAGGQQSAPSVPAAPPSRFQVIELSPRP
jgi:hypothetical protein